MFVYLIFFFYDFFCRAANIAAWRKSPVDFLQNF